MAIKSIDESILHNIGDAIRNKTGKLELFQPAEMAIEILNIESNDTSIEDNLITRNITTYANDRITFIGGYAFRNCTNLTTASFPAVTTIGSDAFRNCSNLTTISFPAATTINYYAFYDCSRLASAIFPVATSIGSSAFCHCSNLTTASFPAVTIINSQAFSGCTNLTTASFPATTTIGFSAFKDCRRLTTASFPAAKTINHLAFERCYNLKSLYLTGSSLCTLTTSNAFSSTPIGGYSKSAGTYGSIYVPASLLTSYQNATNWTYFSSRFVAIEEEPGGLGDAVIGPGDPD